jgi:hypothetical protein
MKKFIVFLTLIASSIILAGLPNACQSPEVKNDWTIEPFTRVDSVNPIIYFPVIILILA